MVCYLNIVLKDCLMENSSQDNDVVDATDKTIMPDLNQLISDTLGPDLYQQVLDLMGPKLYQQVMDVIGTDFQNRDLKCPK